MRPTGSFKPKKDADARKRLLFVFSECLGSFLAVLAVLVVIIAISLKNWSYSYIQMSKIIENCGDTAITVFWKGLLANLGLNLAFQALIGALGTYKALKSLIRL